MQAALRLWLLVTLPALAGKAGWLASGEVVSVGAEGPGAGDAGPGGAGAGGPGPAFAPHQRTSVLAAVGESVTLECRVLRLGDKSVSWVRSRDLQILTHAGAVFTADARVSAPGAHALRIERLRRADAGRYECQVNTDPKRSLLVTLDVAPALRVRALDGGRVRAAPGGAASLACEAGYEPAPGAPPPPAPALRWRRRGRPEGWQRARGGVSLDTERWGPARLLSRLTLAGLRAEDAGPYECAAQGAEGAAAAVELLLDDAESESEAAESMQRDQAQSGAPRARVLALALAAPLGLRAVLLALPQRA